MPAKVVFVMSSLHANLQPLRDLLARDAPKIVVADTHVAGPLAHLGFYRNVEKAPYDHVLAAGSQRLFVEQLPHGENDYVRACRAYCDVLYEKYAEKTGAEVIVDASPDNVLAWKLLNKMYPSRPFVLIPQNPADSLARVLTHEETEHCVESYVQLAAASRALSKTCPQVTVETIRKDPAASRKKLSFAMPLDSVTDPTFSEAHTVAPERELLDYGLRKLDMPDLATLGYTRQDIAERYQKLAHAGLPQNFLKGPGLAIRLAKRAAPAVQQNPHLKKLVTKAHLALNVLLRD